MIKEKLTSFPKERIHALLLENIHPNAQTVFEGEGYRVETASKSLPEKELRDRMPGVHILGIRSRTRVSKEVFDASSHLIALGAFCIGTEQVDAHAASERGIPIFNAPFENTRSVAELAFGEMLMLARGITEKNRLMHQGVWDKSTKGAIELRDKTLGIVGYGNIGKQLGIIAENFGMHVLYYDTAETLSMGNAQKMETMEELLTYSDFVSVHVSGKPENTNLISTAQFELMKPKSFFLNLSRGYVVDIPALAEYIKNGKLGGASVDVFPEEPASNDEEFQSLLKGLQNVILTPHIAGSTKESQENIGRLVAERIVRFINTGDTRLCVNFPQIELPSQGNNHRIVYFHRNTPGVMGYLNSLLADSGANITGQYLKTTGEYGVVITDISTTYDRRILKAIKEHPATIKLRLLY